MNYAGIALARIDQWVILAVIAAARGLFLFFRGFRTLKRKRLILNTPTSKIRSASLGLVEISGLATGPYAIKAPVTGRDCYYYCTVAWKLKKSGRNNEWVKVAEESLHVPFYVDDTTGVLLVNPQGAEMDLHRDFHEEYGDSLFSNEDLPQSVRGFLGRYGVSTENPVRVDEYCIKSKNALFLLGTLAENPGVKVDSKPVKTQPSVNLPQTDRSTRTEIVRFSTTTSAPQLPSLTVRVGQEREIIQLSGGQRPQNSAEMTQQGKIAAALMKAGISNPAAWSAAGIDDLSAAVAMASGREVAVSTSGSAASAAPAPENFDLRPKVVLMKGKNSKDFYISWRSQREVASSLGWKSVAYIWAGPALTLVSVYILLAHLGWL